MFIAMELSLFYQNLSMKNHHSRNHAFDRIEIIVIIYSVIQYSWIK